MWLKPSPSPQPSWRSALRQTNRPDPAALLFVAASLQVLNSAAQTIVGACMALRTVPVCPQQPSNLAIWPIRGGEHRTYRTPFFTANRAVHHHRDASLMIELELLRFSGYAEPAQHHLAPLSLFRVSNCFKWTYSIIIPSDLLIADTGVRLVRRTR